MLRARPVLSLLTLALGIGVSVAVTACDDVDDEIGTPCESIRDCSSDLICDIHDGQGTCQIDHEHRSASPDTDEILLEEEPELEPAPAP